MSVLRTVRRWGRRAEATLRPPAALLCYHLEYRAPANPLIDSERAPRILDYLRREGCIAWRHLRWPRALPVEHLTRVHDFGYLERVGDPGLLLRVFGEEILRVDAEAVIRNQRWMVAGTVMAAHLAIRPGQAGRPVVNLGGGLHHARRDAGAGFCLFNDVAVAVCQLRAKGFVGRILVVDLDLHQGDGTRAFFADDPTVFTFSIHATDWDESPAEADLGVALGPAVGDRRYLAAVEEHLPGVVAEFRPDLVFYVAGVDVAADDKLGSWRVSADGILARDRRVLELAGERPVVWLLAGGYGPDAWRHTARSLAMVLVGHAAPIPSEAERDLRHFRAIARQLTREELAGAPEEDLILRPEDLLIDLVGPGRRSRLLGFYTAYGVELGFERYGVLPHLRRLGYESPELVLDLDHPTGERIRLFSRNEPRELLLELVLRETRQHPPYRLLAIEWLLLQNPRAEPTAARPLLPGQRYPGLGCLKEVAGILCMICERLDYDGLFFCPAHFHVAAQSHGLLSFLDPSSEARFAAIEEATMGLTLAQTTRLVNQGRIVDDRTGEPVTWQAAAMVLPVSEGLKAWIGGEEHERAIEEAARILRYVRRDAAE